MVWLPRTTSVIELSRTTEAPLPLFLCHRQGPSVYFMCLSASHLKRKMVKPVRVKEGYEGSK